MVVRGFPSPGWVWLRSGGGGVLLLGSVAGGIVAVGIFAVGVVGVPGGWWPHQKVRSRIESKNTLAHLVKVDDCSELRFHTGSWCVRAWAIIFNIQDCAPHFNF